MFAPETAAAMSDLSAQPFWRMVFPLNHAPIANALTQADGYGVSAAGMDGINEKA